MGINEPLSQSGPALPPLLHWLGNCPADFMLPPRLRLPNNTFSGTIHTGAVVSDLLRLLTGVPLSAAEAQEFLNSRSKEQPNLLRLVLLCSHVFFHPWFREHIHRCPSPRQSIYEFFKTGLTQLSALVNAEAFVTDPERREELVRLCLLALSLRPEGETEIQALDRLNTVDSVERKKVLQESLAAHKRAEEIRLAMARKEAEEAASKMTRE